jgi:hypothetical protein
MGSRLQLATAVSGASAVARFAAGVSTVFVHQRLHAGRNTVYGCTMGQLMCCHSNDGRAGIP